MIQRKIAVNIAAFCLGLLFVLTIAGHSFAQQPARDSVSAPIRDAIRFQQSAQQAPIEAQGNCSRCRSDIVDLLVPIDDRAENCPPHFSLTVRERPSFYVYIRKLAELKQLIGDNPPHFILYDRQSSTSLYEANFSLPAESGIVQIDLPANVTLEVGKPYAWAIEVVTSFGEIDDIVGWIERIETPSTLSQQLTATTNSIDRARLYANAGIWYDALDTLVQARQNSDSRELQAQWASLFTSIDMNDVERASILSVEVNAAEPSQTAMPTVTRSVKCL